MATRDRLGAATALLATVSIVVSAQGCSGTPHSVAHSAWITTVAPTSDPLVYQAEVVGAENCQVSLETHEEGTIIRIVVRLGSCDTASGEAKPGAPVGTSRWLPFQLGAQRGSRIIVTPDPDDPSTDMTPRVDTTPRS